MGTATTSRVETVEHGGVIFRRYPDFICENCGGPGRANKYDKPRFCSLSCAHGRG